MHAFKHQTENTPALIARIKDAQEQMNTAAKEAQALAGTFPFPVAARYRRNPFNGKHGETFMVPDRTPQKDQIPDGWRFLKTRNTVEPLAGTKGQAAREALAAVQPPEVQPRDILIESGMPEYFTKPGPNFNSYMVVPTYFRLEDAVYSLVNVEELTSDFVGRDPQTFGGEWVECSVSEYYAAYETLEAAA